MDWSKHMRRILERLGEDASYTPAGGQASTVRGMFLEPYQEFQGVVAGSSPAFTCMADDVPAVAQGDAITVHGGSYKVVRPQNVSVSGLVMVHLEEL